ncbi:hypothetical protein EPH_0007860 [Eimeria praecox]|uniref:Uncharacterized protein n=1 Tax=Eimeria praecox TaxID=51316 RepID=U6GH03_9EIME|nr:hypothetical protein EPH_0007860 [Eimeria praecox]
MGNETDAESRSAYEEAADSAAAQQTAGAQFELELTRDEVEETRQVEKMRSEKISLMEEASGSDEAPQKTGVQPDVEPIREHVEETQQAEHEPCERGTEEAEKSAYPIGEGVKTSRWREPGETAEFGRCGVLGSVRTTVVLRVDVDGSQCEAFFDTEASNSFLSQEKVDRLQLKARRPSEEYVYKGRWRGDAQ